MDFDLCKPNQIGQTNYETQSIGEKTCKTQTSIEISVEKSAHKNRKGLVK